MSRATSAESDNPTHLVVDARLAVPLDEFEFEYMRSSGPGGQNVNKVNSKVMLRWNFAASGSLPIDVAARFHNRYANRLTRDGVLVLFSQRYRDQPRNRADCLEKLRAMIADVALAPTKRKKTRPSRGSVERRLQEKRKSSQRKAERRPPRPSAD